MNSVGLCVWCEEKSSTTCKANMQVAEDFSSPQLALPRPLIEMTLSFGGI